MTTTPEERWHGEERRVTDHDGIVRLDTIWAAHITEHKFEREQRELAAKELARRLTELNNSAQRAARIENTYVPREVYEASQRELAQRAEAVAAVVSTYLPREVFDAYVKDQQVREQRSAESLLSLTRRGEGDTAGSNRVQSLVFALFGVAGVVAAIVFGLTR
jgi:hypothetical protein